MRYSAETVRAIVPQIIADSRGRETLRVTVNTQNAEGAFDVPSGASTGSHEAHELRDAKGGVSNAVEMISRVIEPALRGIPAAAQTRIDETLVALDGTPTKERLGGNSMIGVSIAVARAAARAAGVSLCTHLRSLADIAPSRRVPLLFVNLINGGKHAHGGSPIQEHQIIPDTDDVDSALSAASAIYESLGQILSSERRAASEGDEGGYVFSVSSLEEPFELLARAVKEARLTERVFIGSDIAASTFAAGSAYEVLGQKRSAADLSELYLKLHSSVGLRFIEDPFGEEVFTDFASLCRDVPELVVIGDDLTTTNPARIQRAADESSIDALIIKPNQIGTLTETLEAMRVARNNGIDCIVSHRSGETMDDFIADLAFAFGCFGLKAGAPHKPERRVKYERLATLVKENL